ncbi:MAG: 3-isopropylmalate dehydratase small subunit [Chitinivibrionales bacterium]|nr:3-isopropylmalate dehydratase small subunit [Chitinivibrionales bacterium]MBD3358878.1 3-isopropylmalate dehydratase small subunit [Chitinivibrionales bacterium]
MKAFGGPVIFLDRSDINTDEIIPAKYLTEVSKEALKPYLLEDLKIEGFDPSSEVVLKGRVLVTRSNFGCGSSREHAPWALEVNDFTLVIAASYARIFRQNMFNCGMLAVELPTEKIDELFALDGKGEVLCAVDLDDKTLSFSCEGKGVLGASFSLREFDEALVRAGGWVEFADARY